MTPIKLRISGNLSFTISNVRDNYWEYKEFEESEISCIRSTCVEVANALARQLIPAPHVEVTEYDLSIEGISYFNWRMINEKISKENLGLS